MNTIFTTDLYVAVFLKAKYGLKILAKEKEGKFTFYFENASLGEKNLIESYYNGNDLVSANAFVRELKDLKAYIHNSK